VSVLVGGKLAPAANSRRSGPQELKPLLKWPKMARLEAVPLPFLAASSQLIVTRSGVRLPAPSMMTLIFGRAETIASASWSSETG